MILKEKILEYLSDFSGATDGEIAKALGKIHQNINQTCRELECEGYLIRSKKSNKNNLIGNYWLKCQNYKKFYNAK